MYVVFGSEVIINSLFEMLRKAIGYMTHTALLGLEQWFDLG